MPSGGFGGVDTGYGVGQGGTINPQGGTFTGAYVLSGTITGGTLSGVTNAGAQTQAGTIGGSRVFSGTITQSGLTWAGTAAGARVEAGTITHSASGIAGTSTVTLVGAANSTLDLTAGTYLGAPYATSSPVPVANGHLSIYHKANVAYIAIRSGGTAMVMAFPSATNGTATFTVNSVP